MPKGSQFWPTARSPKKSSLCITGPTAAVVDRALCCVVRMIRHCVSGAPGAVSALAVTVLALLATASATSTSDEVWSWAQRLRQFFGFPPCSLPPTSCCLRPPALVASGFSIKISVCHVYCLMCEALPCPTNVVVWPCVALLCVMVGVGDSWSAVNRALGPPCPHAFSTFPSR